jgi:hypothetical protein
MLVPWVARSRALQSTVALALSGPAAVATLFLLMAQVRSLCAGAAIGSSGDAHSVAQALHRSAHALEGPSFLQIAVKVHGLEFLTNGTKNLLPMQSTGW